MTNTVSLIIRSADKTRKAGVTLPDALTVDQLLKAVQQRWELPSHTDYAMRLERTGQQLHPEMTLEGLGVCTDDIIEFYPILEAGKV